MYRLPTAGVEVIDEEFDELRKICIDRLEGKVGITRFYELMREHGFTRAKAHQVCYDIINGLYEHIEKIEFVDILVSVSLRTTSTMGTWSDRYFEGWLRTAVPVELEGEAAGGDVDEAIFMRCNEIDYLGDLLLKSIYIYFESKGYEKEMLDTSKWYAGVKSFRKYEDHIDMEIKFIMDIYDKGSANRAVNIHRWHDEIPMIKRYWENLADACKHFRKEAFKRAYFKHMGKGVSW